MELTFHSQDEFESFARTYLRGLDGSASLTHTIGSLSQTISATTADAVVAIHRATQADTDLTEAELVLTEAPADGTDDGLTHEHIDLPDAEPSADSSADSSAVEAPKRKRRTKAEIEAERLAAEAGKVDPGSQVQEPLTDAQTDAVQPDATPEPVKTPDVPTQPLGASPEALAKVAEARAAYTPELIEELKAHADLFEPNRLEHMNEAREAISKKGFIPYNATMHGLGLASSIATYTDAEVKLHRAAIARLLAG